MEASIDLNRIGINKIAASNTSEFGSHGTCVLSHYQG